MLRLSEGRGIPGGTRHTVRGGAVWPSGIRAYQQISGGECLQGTSADGGYEYADAAAFGNGEKVVLNRGYKNEFLQFIKERRTQK